jgi:hypothetical protein
MIVGIGSDPCRIFTVLEHSVRRMRALMDDAR